MKKQLILIIAMILAAGCSQKEGAGTNPAPSPSVTAAAPEAATGTPGASASPNASPTSGTGVTGGGAGAAGEAPSGGIAAPEKMVSITKAQVDKLGPTSTYNDLVKIVGKNVKPIKEGSGKKTYELKISDETNLFVDLTYFSDGKMSEKSVFRK